MSEHVTQKALDALLLISAGRRDLISRQMIDRLSARGFIDFAVDRDGWFVTEEGYDIM